MPQVQVIEPFHPVIIRQGHVKILHHLDNIAYQLKRGGGNNLDQSIIQAGRIK
jgi:hypothetical protein